MGYDERTLQGLRQFFNNPDIDSTWAEEHLAVTSRSPEPTDEEVAAYMEQNKGISFYNARETLRERAYGGKPPHGYSSWGLYWEHY